uniref:Uncharacterized protein n=1 Tax=Anguilla anguilla TaxID=7936 RepID=A0A0E9UW52_ANGAN
MLGRKVEQSCFKKPATAVGHLATVGYLFNCNQFRK